MSDEGRAAVEQLEWVKVQLLDEIETCDHDTWDQLQLAVLRINDRIRELGGVPVR